MRWDELLPDEQRVLEAVEKGQPYDGGWEFRLAPAPGPVAVPEPGPHDETTDDAPKRPGESASKEPAWREEARANGERREHGHGPFEWIDGQNAHVPRVRGEFIRALYMQRCVNVAGERVTVTAAGIVLSGVRVAGKVDLQRLSAERGGHLPSLKLTDVWLDSPLSMTDFVCKGVELYDCLVERIVAVNLHTFGDFYVEGCQPVADLTTLINLRSANIGSDVRITFGDSRMPSPEVPKIKARVLLGSAQVGGELHIHYENWANNFTSIRPLKSEHQTISLQVDCSLAKIGGECEITHCSLAPFQGYGAEIGSDLTIDCVTASRVMNLVGCVVGGRVFVQTSTLDVLNMSLCKIAGLVIGREPIEGRDSQISRLVIDDAQVAGDFAILSTTFGVDASGNPLDGIQECLSGYGLKVGGDFTIGPHRVAPTRPSFNGPIYLSRAQVGGVFKVSGAKFHSSTGLCLGAAGIIVNGAVDFLSHYDEKNETFWHFEANATVSFSRAEVRQWVRFQGATIDSGDSDAAVNLSAATVGSGVYFRAQRSWLKTGPRFVSGLSTRGCVDLSNAIINAGVFGDGSVLRAIGSPQSEFSRHDPDKFSVGDTRPQNLHHIALNLQEAEVKGTVRLRHAYYGLDEDTAPAFEAFGAVDLRNAHVTGDIDLRGAQLIQDVPMPRHPAVDPADAAAAVMARGLVVGGSLRLSNDDDCPQKFMSMGRLRLDHADIARDLILTGGGFDHSKLKDAGRTVDPVAFSLCNAKISGELVVEDDYSAGPSRIARAFGNADTLPKRNGLFDLSGASARVLRDRRGLGWGYLPEPTFKGDWFNGVALKLDGFSYERLADASREPIDEPVASGLRRLQLILRKLTPTWLWMAPREVFDLVKFPFDILKDRLHDIQDVLTGQALDRRPLPATGRPEWRNRIQWLERQFIDGRYHERHYYASAYEQLERAFERVGRLEDARRIARHQRAVEIRCGLRNPLERLTAFFYWALFRFGFSPGAAALSLAVYLFIGQMAAGQMIHQNWLVENQPGNPPAKCKSVGPWAFALDKMAPVLSIGTKDLCRVQAGPAPLRLGPSILPLTYGKEEGPRTVNFLIALYSAFGALMVGLTLLTFSGILRRNRPTGSQS